MNIVEKSEHVKPNGEKANDWFTEVTTIIRRDTDWKKTSHLSSKEYVIL